MKQQPSADHSCQLSLWNLKLKRKAPFAQCRLLRQRKRRQVIAFDFWLAAHSPRKFAHSARQEIELALGFKHEAAK
jgi:hypothetical protein